MKVTYDDVSFLFTGDVESKGERDILNSYKKELNSTILKVSHHGSNTSSSDEFIRWVNPSEAIISVGKDNKYNHPNKEIVNLFKSKNIDIYTTEEYGDILIKTDGKHYKIFN